MSSAFLEAYRRCMARTDGPPEHFMAFPAIVCAAFSAEVGLKTLLKLEGARSHGHDLLALFRRLSDESKLAVLDATGVAMEEFAAHLGHSKEAFVEWRYVYEAKGEKHISVEFMGKLAAAIESRALEVKRAV
jgi:hypothetical protein